MGINGTIADQECRVNFRELRWDLRPAARLEHVEPEALLTLSPVELLAYVHDLRADLDATRETLHQGFALVARQQDQLARAGRVVEFQRQQLRTRRELAAA